ncbi:hypothetical protein [Stenotrophomonas sp. S39]|uniref:hypothetical protein n=1 Tax=Stenotrophomonas sp. S39 TaxID=2767451 RepID=UPI0019097587|nr:hypothetical protein [Stenotrophomonas sp. S39]MBK0054671.1 hypothetical protein [Stenotrophomonas sp. S39]
MLKSLYHAYEDPAVALALQSACEAQVVSWRWATDSMGYDEPYISEIVGARPSRWVPDAKADARRHVRHGLDADGRIVLERGSSGRTWVWLYQGDCRYYIDFSSGGYISGVSEFRESNGRLQSLKRLDDSSSIDSTYDWDGDQLLRTVTCSRRRGERVDWRQHLFSYTDGGQLDCIVLEYMDRYRRPIGQQERIYQRPRPGETLATVTADVERLLIEAIAAQLPRIPRDEPLYCLLLCFTESDFTAAWPPFLVWGRQPYREAVLARGEDVAYYLWAPDEMRGVQGDAHECWFDDVALVEACRRHSQYMEMRGSDASAKRVLKNVAAWLDAPERRALLAATDDFVVAVADNTGSIDPLPGLRRAIGPERWARLKERGYV